MAALPSCHEPCSSSTSVLREVPDSKGKSLIPKGNPLFLRETPYSIRENPCSKGISFIQ